MRTAIANQRLRVDVGGNMISGNMISTVAKLMFVVGLATCEFLTYAGGEIEFQEKNQNEMGPDSVTIISSYIFRRDPLLFKSEVFYAHNNQKVRAH